MRSRPTCARLAFIITAACAIISTATAQDGQSDPLAVARLHLGAQEWSEAAAVLRSITTSHPENANAWHLLGYALHADGRIDEALPYHLMGTEFEQTAAISMYNVACVYALKGNSDKAFAWLEKSVTAGFAQAQQLRTDSDLDSIRSDERFEKIIESMRLPSPSVNGPRLMQVLPPDQRAERISQAKREFDFWVGEWDVYDADGNLAGTNSITLAHNDNALIERWTSSKGSTGTSVNFYNPNRRRWTQVWVDDGGNIIMKDGRFVDGTMRFEGSHILPTGERRAFRANFTPNDDGSVRQFIEESTDGGRTWQVWFDGKYVRKGEIPSTASIHGEQEAADVAGN